MQALYESKNASLENTLLESLAPDEPWSMVERFTTLVRESSSDDERTAFDYIADRLSALGVPHTMHMPELFLSVPVSASLVAGGVTYRAKTPAFPSAHRRAVSLAKRCAFKIIPRNAESISSISRPRPKLTSRARSWWSMALADRIRFGTTRIRERRGAIFINPGVDIHWSICTTIWGAPDLDNYQRQPTIPVVSINRPDGEKLLAQMGSVAGEVTLHAELKEGWFECPCLVAEVKGNVEPERFVLAHGHLDSWDVGIGDNAVGDATLLELARSFHNNRDQMARSLRLAWWSGHSTGRYGASTWYADAFGLDLARNCVAQMNIDSPGCRWATEYRVVTVMSEAEGIAAQSIMDSTGQGATGGRPMQAGDYSFNNIGISGLFMLLSSMPLAKAEEMGYYRVGGCGANIAWHTENDTLEIADKDNLMRDLRVYTTSLQRLLNNPLHPFDFRSLTAEFKDTLDTYAAAAGDDADFGAGVQRARGLKWRAGWSVRRDG